MQTKEAKKERKGNLDWCLWEKRKAMSANAESLYCREKNVSDEILNGNFLHFWLYNMNFMHTEAGIQIEDRICGWVARFWYKVFKID